MPDSYKTIAIDFDGVIARYDGWKGIGVFGDPIPGVREAFCRIRSLGCVIIVHTTRGEVGDIQKYLEVHKIPYDHINSNPRNEVHMNPGKPIADVYVDDRAINFAGRWDDEFVDRMLRHSPWHKQKFRGRVDEILDRAIDTYQSRQAVYQDSYIVHGSVMADLFAGGLSLKAPKDFARYALVDMIVGKLVRYTRDFGAMHQDSIHDLMVYSAMLQEVDGMDESTWIRGQRPRDIDE